MFFTKVSIVLFYHRLFIIHHDRWTPLWWSIWFVFWWNLLYAVALIVTVLTECVGKGERVAKGENCVNQYAVLIGASVVNVVTDLMLLFIPVAVISRLHMSPRKKWKWSAVFAVGILCVAATHDCGFLTSRVAKLILCF